MPSTLLLPQLADAGDRRQTVRQTILDRVGVTAANAALDHWSGALAAGDLNAVQSRAEALERWLALGGADVDARLQRAVAELGLKTAFLDRPLGALSGGQAARAASRRSRWPASTSFCSTSPATIWMPMAFTGLARCCGRGPAGS